jgi:hypothetical protein
MESGGDCVAVSLSYSQIAGAGETLNREHKGRETLGKTEQYNRARRLVMAETRCDSLQRCKASGDGAAPCVI